jgi:hypothetical protein
MPLFSCICAIFCLFSSPLNGDYSPEPRRDPEKPREFAGLTPPEIDHSRTKTSFKNR